MATCTSGGFAIDSFGKSFCSRFVRFQLSLPGIQVAAASSPKTIPSKTAPGFSIVKTLPPRWSRLAGETQATRVLSFNGQGEAGATAFFELSCGSAAAAAIAAASRVKEAVVSRGFMLMIIVGDASLRAIAQGHLRGEARP